MTLKDLLLQIIFKFVFAGLFLYFGGRTVLAEGWSFFAILNCFFATNSIVQGVRLLETYFLLKKNNYTPK